MFSHHTSLFLHHVHSITFIAISKREIQQNSKNQKPPKESERREKSIGLPRVYVPETYLLQRGIHLESTRYFGSRPAPGPSFREEIIIALPWSGSLRLSRYPDFCCRRFLLRLFASSCPYYVCNLFGGLAFLETIGISRLMGRDIFFLIVRPESSWF